MSAKEDFGIELILYDNDYIDRSHYPSLTYDLIYLLDGAADVTAGDCVYHLQKDDIILMNAGQKYQWKQAEETVFCVISFSRELLFRETGSPNLFFRCNSADDKEADYLELRRIIGLLLLEYSIDMSSLNLKKKACFYELLDILLNRFVIQNQSNLYILAEDKAFTRVLKYIRDHYSSPLSLHDAACQVYMNDSAFSRYFKKNAGINFLEYLNDLRLQSAMEELLHTDKSLTRIALDNGFTNLSMFSRAFRKVYGSAPVQYRKQKRSVMKKADERTSAISAGSRSKLVQFIEQNTNHNTGIFSRQISIDKGQMTLYEKTWNRCINAGALTDLLQARMQKDLCELKKELGISYIRIVNVFSRDTYIQKNTDSGHYNFELVDHVLDFLLENGMRPFFELGDKPRRIILDVNELVFLKEEPPVFRSLSDFRKVLTKFMDHLVNRYGSSEVDHWLFELGFNPKETDFDFYGYLENYELASRIIKTAAPEAKVGAYLFLQLADRDEVNRWFESHRKPDFISQIIFPYQRYLMKGDSADKSYGKRIADIHFFHNALKQLKDELYAFQLQDIPVVISEWNISLSDRDPYNDSCGKAAQMVMQMAECLSEIPMAAYLSATDLNSIYFDTNAEFFGGTGIVNKNGLKKPSFYALKFMNQMGSYLVQRGEGYLVTADGRNNYDILMYNAKHFNYSFYSKREDEIPDEDLPGIFSDDNPLELRFVLEDMPEGQYQIRTTILGIENGSIYSAWKKLGKEYTLTREDREYLERISIPRISIRRLKTINGKLTITEQLNAHDIGYLHIHKEQD